ESVERRRGDRRDEKRDEEGEGLSPDDHPGDRAPRPRPRPPTEGDRHHAEDQHYGGHEDGPEPHSVSLEDGLVARLALRAQRVRVVDLQDAVLLDDAEEHEEPERAVDVDALAPPEEAGERAR